MFVVLGVWITVDGHVLAGPFCVVVFGLGAVVYFRRMRADGMLFELTPEGLRPSIGGIVPWRDIEVAGVGVGPRSLGVVGIRLSDYTAYARSLPPDKAQWKWAAIWAKTRIVARPTPADLAGMSMNWALLTEKEQDLAGLLIWNRKKYGGLDIFWVERMLPDPSQVVIGQILDYQAKVLSR
ncbi:hypothetical protein [Kribbella sp. NPDC048928]|uniref:hypothetical protein n=1 Tax=Kribbella sp. NPDC048928 TaxID=3364111 RepID=UPI003718CAB4